MKQKTEIKSQYDLHLEIEIRSGSSGEVIDTMFEDEHYDTVRRLEPPLEVPNLREV